MTVQLHHAPVPSMNPEASAEWFSRIMDLPLEGTSVRLNQTQVLQFVPRERFAGLGGERHFCFRTGDREFDGILARVRGEGIAVRSDPGGPGQRAANDQINYYDNGRGFYFTSPDGHGFEVITHPYVRGSRAPKGKTR
ncbi:MAG TPA: VOC family protein [Chloroflexota bacterium]|jgi:catechol 2,3-dioxygenase-like lactoylglutathione lyase family enzyme